MLRVVLNVGAKVVTPRVVTFLNTSDEEQVIVQAGSRPQKEAPPSELSQPEFKDDNHGYSTTYSAPTAESQQNVEKLGGVSVSTRRGWW